MNKTDCLYGWQSEKYCAVKPSLSRQVESCKAEFEDRKNKILLQLSEQGLNCALYWENENQTSCFNIVPTSALTGEGVPDLLYVLLNFSQNYLSKKLLHDPDELQCTVIEVKSIEGLGTTIDVVLVNGTLRQGDEIVLAGINGAIRTTIRALKTPQPMKEMRVKNVYVDHPEIRTSMGVKICAPHLEEAVAGSELRVLRPDDDIEEIMEEVGDFQGILNDVGKMPEGVLVKASTLGSLEALLTFVKDEMKIPVSEYGIGEVTKNDVKKTFIQRDRRRSEYALILAFDIPVNKEAQAQADKDGVKIFTADIIYHLQDRFRAHMIAFAGSKKAAAKHDVVFPVILEIDKQCIIRKKDPMILGCDIIGGQLRVGTPLCVPEKGNIEIGRVVSIEMNRKPVEIARHPQQVCVKIEQTTMQSHITLGRHFEVNDKLYSKISRQSVDVLKDNFRDEVSKDDWALIKGMKEVFKIQ